MKTLRLGEVEVQLRPDDTPPRVRTIWPDGSHLTVNVVDSPLQRELAAHYGYAPGDYLTLNLEHDPAHSILADALGHPYSLTLWLVAKGGERHPVARAAVEAEEAAVWGLVRLMNTGEWHPHTLPTLSEAEARALAEEARTLLRSPRCTGPTTPRKDPPTLPSDSSSPPS